MQGGCYEDSKIGILGLGTVGGGTYQILDMNRELIEKRIDRRIEVVKVLEKNMERIKALGLDESQATQNPDDILKNPDIDIVVEALGGIEPSTTFMLTAMEHGKGVVTPNKAAVAANFDKLKETAAKHGVGFRFEASVGGRYSCSDCNYRSFGRQPNLQKLWVF